jgi:hypothetical protein
MGEGAAGARRLSRRSWWCNPCWWRTYGYSATIQTARNGASCRLGQSRRRTTWNGGLPRRVGLLQLGSGPSGRHPRTGAFVCHQPASGRNVAAAASVARARGAPSLPCCCAARLPPRGPRHALQPKCSNAARITAPFHHRFCSMNSDPLKNSCSAPEEVGGAQPPSSAPWHPSHANGPGRGSSLRPRGPQSPHLCSY